ncbi:hypothetical protein BC936DRAFT_148976 [Jimgerdemannia flammicorona]|uniref:Uncharacterized protein n=1 Tax=Jimgerdemannia flammicorona TaxID=994334 RepID=A0A433D1V3_9FUNG|nr:hypothetical protein BC936DRAFT_148976 [Jimgerdemannia flammicorona]
MNSTTNPLDFPKPDDIITPAAAWFGFAYSFLGLVIITRKVFIDYTQIRVGCTAVGATTMVLAIANVLRLSSTIPELIFGVLQTTFMVLWMDLMVAITFHIGGRFHMPEERTGIIYWATLTITLFANVLGLASLIIMDGLQILGPGAIVNTAARAACLVAMVLVLWYAFTPVICIKARKGEAPAAVVVVGTW